jgi:hypothetical protein
MCFPERPGLHDDWARSVPAAIRRNCHASSGGRLCSGRFGKRASETGSAQRRHTEFAGV